MQLQPRQKSLAATSTADVYRLHSSTTAQQTKLSKHKGARMLYRMPQILSVSEMLRYASNS